MSKDKRSVKELVAIFKQVLKEASEFYQKPMCNVNINEYTFMNKGRLGVHKVSQLGGFGKLKAYVAPDKNNPLDKATKQMLEKIMGL